MVIDAIRGDPDWKGGTTRAAPEPAHGRADALLHEQQPGLAQRDMPTLAKADTVLDAYVANYVRTADANDIMYAVSASRDYDPAPDWRRSAPACWRSTRATT